MDIETVAARGLQILLALGGAYLIALWFVLAVWTFRDIETRSRSVVTQVFSTLLVVLFWVPGLLLYRLLRPSETLDEAYQRSLEEEYLIQDLEELPLCPSCNHFVEDDFQICPHCNTQLREPCTSCERLIDLRWEVCPYCGTQHHGHHEQAETQVPVTKDDDRWVDPALIEKRLRDGEYQRTREETRALPAATAATTLGRDLFQAPGRQEPGEAAVPGSRDQTGSLNGQSVVLRRREVPVDTDRASTSSEAQQATVSSPHAPVGPDLSGLIDNDAEDQHPDDTDTTKVPDRYRVK
ncbi:MAG: zinc ribbon domain-containing protein [Chloroflexota bacterium]|nr:zinc ribbon domain-containing protein [Chloroflexota bacterium]